MIIEINFIRKLFDKFILKYFFYSSIFVVLDFIFYIFLISKGFTLFLSFFISAVSILIISYILLNILVFKKKPTTSKLFLYLTFHLLSIIFFSNLNKYLFIFMNNYVHSKALILPISFVTNYFFSKYIIMYKSTDI